MKYLFFSVVILSSIACETDDLSDPVLTDELIIGLSYLECGGDCAFLYQLKGDKVYTDDGVERVESVVDGLNFSSPPIAYVTQARYDSLFSYLPSGLDDYVLSDFGCPDCGDWGSLHVIRTTESGEYLSYVLDNQTESMAAGLQSYGRLIQRSLVEFRR